LRNISNSDTFIPVTVNRNAADNVEGGCQEHCFPRELKLEVLYHQVSKFKKRIVESSLVMDGFDKNATNQDYDLEVSFRALNYEELIIKFVFGQDIFVLLFCAIGGFTVIVTSLFWLVIRLSTRLESPPKLRFIRMVNLIVPNAIIGFVMGLLPIATVTGFVLVFFRGYILAAPIAILGIEHWSLFDSILPLHFYDIAVDPSTISAGQKGRMGLAFISLAAIFVNEGSKLFVPEVYSRLENKIQEIGSQTLNRSNWTPQTWKQANFIFSSFCMGILLVALVEFSFWQDFGNNIWLFLFGLQILGVLASDVVKAQVSEELLQSPIMMALGLVQGIMTLSANDFIDFLTSYLVSFGFIMLQRMYLDPFQSVLYDLLIVNAKVCWKKISPRIYIQPASNNAIENIRKPSFETINPESSVEVITVEPIIKMYGDYCSDTLGLLCTPCIILFLMVFRRETLMADLYGIKESDMKHYLFFSLIIIPFQIAADIFIHGSLELFHGWRIHDYLLYCKYRFRERELLWRGLERNTLDESIDEDLRTLDHLCFSNQYYMMLFIHTSGIMYFVFGTEMIIRAKYNPFGDPAFLLIVPTVALVSLFVKNVFIWVSLQLGLWKPRSSTVQWYADTRATTEKPEPLNLPSQKDSFSIEKRMTEESFRFRFLDYNRNWLMSQLPNILTPRTVRRSRPFIVNQFAKILTSLNDDISSDSETDDLPPRYKITDGILNGTSRSMIKSWLYRGKRRVDMKRIAEPLIQRERGEYCEQCLSRKELKVQTLVEFDKIEKGYRNAYEDAEFVQTTWRNYWMAHQRYQTLCLQCISYEKEKLRKARFAARYTSSILPNSIGDATTAVNEEMQLSTASKQILKKWHETAKGNRRLLQDKRTHDPNNINKADTNAVLSTKISVSSKDIAIDWLSKARTRVNLSTHHAE